MGRKESNQTKQTNQIRVRIGKQLVYFSYETYAVGTQKNPLNETVLLSTQTHVLIDEKENNYNYTLIKFPYLDL